MFEGYSHLKFNRKGHVLEVILDNPPTNAINKGLHTELSTVFDDIERDPETRVVVITGAGERAFSAGGDFGDMFDYLSDAPGFIATMQEAQKIVYGLVRLSKPTIARINGHAIGLGATLGLFCDLSYAVPDAKIADPHVSVGFAAGDGGALIWPQLIGYARAREYLLTGDPILGRDAGGIGLVTRSVERDKLDEVVFGMAERLSSGATKAISYTKVAINSVLRRHFETLAEMHAALELMSNFTEDHREAVIALREKRKPVFTGR